MIQIMEFLYQEKTKQIEIRDTPHQITKIRQQAEKDIQTITDMIEYLKKQYSDVKELDVVKNHLLYFQKKV